VFAPGATAPLATTTITVFLSDGTVEVSTSFQLTVTTSASSTPPVLGAIGNRTVTEGSSTSVMLSATDGDGDALNWTVALPGFVNLTVTQSGPGSSTARLDLVPGFCDAGIHPASVTVSDGTGSDSESFTITVHDLNRAPEWQTPAGGFQVSLTAGSSTSLNVTASDPDQACGGPAPALTVSGSNAGSALTLSLQDGGNGGGVFHVTAAAGTPSSNFEVRLRATDGAASSVLRETTVAVHVTAAESPVLARAWFEKDPLRLDIGRPRERVFLEPKEASFRVFDVVLSSIRLRAWTGGHGGRDRPARGPVPVQRPRPELHLRSAYGVREGDLRALLAHVVETTSVPLTLTATLTTGLTVGDVPDARLGARARARDQARGSEPPQSGSLDRCPDAGGRRAYGSRLRSDGAPRPDDRGRSLHTAGDHVIRFDGKDDRGMTLSSGRYFVRVDVPGDTDSRAITVVK
jgi:hypothetical protein